MTNNYILILIQRAEKLSKMDILRIYKLIDKKITFEDVEDVLRAEQDEKFILLSDEGFGMFLDGLIIDNRGPSDKKRKNTKFFLNNNVILKKLRIAFNLQDEDMIKAFELGEVSMIKSQLSSFFRKEGHPNYKRCSDTKLKSFIKGCGKLRRKDEIQ